MQNFATEIILCGILPMTLYFHLSQINFNEQKFKNMFTYNYLISKLYYKIH